MAFHGHEPECTCDEDARREKAVKELEQAAVDRKKAEGVVCPDCGATLAITVESDFTILVTVVKHGS